MPFDIRQLRHAIAAADHGSFYRAARALDVEQSTLSRNIIRLERVIGVKLFNRSRSGVTTTIAGTHFIRSARPMVASADKIVSAMRAAGQGRAGVPEDRSQYIGVGRQSARVDIGVASQ